MKDEKYIVIVNGVLKFRNGKKILKGGLVPPDISKDEIEDKLKREQIAVFNSEISAMVQSANISEVNIVLDLKNKIKDLEAELKILKAESEKPNSKKEKALKEEVEKLNGENKSLQIKIMELEELLESAEGEK